MNQNTIPLSAITPSSTNPRRTFDKAKLEELADSVKRYGILQPILVRPNGEADTYELVAGEGRFRAAKAAGLM
jgi:ParB family chromosome partitioning protein